MDNKESGNSEGKRQGKRGGKKREDGREEGTNVEEEWRENNGLGLLREWMTGWEGNKETSGRAEDDGGKEGGRMGNKGA